MARKGWRCLQLSLGVFVAFAANPTPAEADKPFVDKFNYISSALEGCWHPPRWAEGMEMTVRFGVNRTGALMGEPRITYSKENGTKE